MGPVSATNQHFVLFHFLCFCSLSWYFSEWWSPLPPEEIVVSFVSFASSLFVSQCGHTIILLCRRSSSCLLQKKKETIYICKTFYTHALSTLSSTIWSKFFFDLENFLKLFRELSGLKNFLHSSFLKNSFGQNLWQLLIIKLFNYWIFWKTLAFFFMWGTFLRQFIDELLTFLIRKCILFPRFGGSVHL